MEYSDLLQPGYLEHHDDPDYYVSIVCDECCQPFECQIDQAFADLAFKEDQGVPIVCSVCLPQDPDEDAV